MRRLLPTPMSTYLKTLCLGIVLGLAACAQMPAATPPLARFEPLGGYRFVNHDRGPGNSSSLLVVLTFSGGGTPAGTRFEFIQEQFDLLCADLRGFPISRAVAASAAVPVFMSPITVRNRAGSCGYPSAAWVDKALQERKLSSRQFHYASKLRSYLDADERPHIHLLDGGLADNLALRSPLEAVFIQDDAWALALRGGIADVRKVVFIVVHASTGPDLAWNKMAAIPGVSQVLQAFKDIPIDRYSFETKQLLMSSFGPWAADIKTQRKAAGDAAGDDLEFALVDVDFDALRSRAERHALMHIPTTSQLDPATVARIRASAKTLLDESASFQRLLTDLHGVRRASAHER